MEKDDISGLKDVIEFKNDLVILDDADSSQSEIIQ
jgi:hypothetical protein